VVHTTYNIFITVCMKIMYGTKWYVCTQALSSSLSSAHNFRSLHLLWCMHARTDTLLHTPILLHACFQFLASNCWWYMEELTKIIRLTWRSCMVPNGMYVRRHFPRLSPVLITSEAYTYYDVCMHAQTHYYIHLFYYMHAFNFWRAIVGDTWRNWPRSSVRTGGCMP